MNCEPTADRLIGLESQILGTIRTAVPCSARRRVAIACRIFTNLQFRGEFFQQLGKRAERILRRRINPLRILSITSLLPPRCFHCENHAVAPTLGRHLSKAVPPRPPLWSRSHRSRKNQDADEDFVGLKSAPGDRNRKIDTGGGGI